MTTPDMPAVAEAGYLTAALRRAGVLDRGAVRVTKPVWQWSVDIPPVVWWNNLERVFLAVEDLGCRELLE